MELLKVLEGIRSPFLNEIMSIITVLGDETFFMVVGMIMLWCVSKKWGYRLMLIGMTGTAFNQLLKYIFLIPRPWVLDPTFTIVESAREGATGYSFPSGHTHSAVSVFGTLAMWVKDKVMTVICILMIALVAFSRAQGTAGVPVYDAQVLSLFITGIAAAEVAIGLALIVAMFRARRTVESTALNSLKD